MEIVEGTLNKPERIPSTIQFPYSDISDAVAVADGLLRGGGMALTRDQLAASMGQTPTSGSFNTKVNTARIFGVLESSGGKYQLTKLGFEIVDPARQKEAMIAAFLTVELYRRTYEEFRGKRLPPRPHGLEHAFLNFGVSPKQTRNARLAFEKSARLAGFYPGGDEDRLVMPFGTAGTTLQPLTAGEAQPPEPVVVEAVGSAAGTASVQGVSASIHKSILGMLDELPPPKTQWSKAEQADWLEAVATLFQVIYKSDDEGSIKVTYIEQPPPVRRQPPEY